MGSVGASGKAMQGVTLRGFAALVVLASVSSAFYNPEHRDAFFGPMEEGLVTPLMKEHFEEFELRRQQHRGSLAETSGDVISLAESGEGELENNARQGADVVKDYEAQVQAERQEIVDAKAAAERIAGDKVAEDKAAKEKLAKSNVDLAAANSKLKDAEKVQTKELEAAAIAKVDRQEAEAKVAQLSAKLARWQAVDAAAKRNAVSEAAVIEATRAADEATVEKIKSEQEIAEAQRDASAEEEEAKKDADEEVAVAQKRARSEKRPLAKEAEVEVAGAERKAKMLEDSVKESIEAEIATKKKRQEQQLVAERKRILVEEANVKSAAEAEVRTAKAEEESVKQEQMSTSATMAAKAEAAEDAASKTSAAANAVLTVPGAGGKAVLEAEMAAVAQTELAKVEKTAGVSEENVDSEEEEQDPRMAAVKQALVVPAESAHEAAIKAAVDKAAIDAEAKEKAKLMVDRNKDWEAQMDAALKPVHLAAEDSIDQKTFENEARAASDEAQKPHEPKARDCTDCEKPALGKLHPSTEVRLP